MNAAPRERVDFDEEVYLRACEPPSFRAGGRTYRGRILSALEMQAFSPQLALMEAGAYSDDESLALMREFVEALFPAPAPHVTRHWFGLVRRPLPQVTPADAFFAMPIGAQLEALRGFARCLALALLGPGDPMDDGSALTIAGGEAPRPPSGSS